MSRGARILFVEDEAAIADPFGRALARQGFEVIAARSVSEARARFARQPPDLVLLDLTLPDGDGRDLCRELRSASQVPIIMLTARGTELDRVTGLEIGADDYVVKPFSGAEVVEPAARRAAVEGRELALSRKEFDLLAELARHAGTVVTREQLMARVWDENWFGSTKTLDVHMGWLRRKLGDDASMPRYLHTIRGVGFRLVAPEDDAPAQAAS